MSYYRYQKLPMHIQLISENAKREHFDEAIMRLSYRHQRGRRAWPLPDLVYGVAKLREYFDGLDKSNSLRR